MLNAFIISFRLRITYRTNGILFSLKSIPLIKKILPVTLYKNRKLKTFASILSIIAEVISIFLGKAIYLLVLLWLAGLMRTPMADSFAHIILFLTIIGGFLNTQIFNPTKDKYYAIFIMRLDARKYALSNYIYYLLKTLVGLLPCSLVFASLYGVGTLVSLSVPIFVLAVKLSFTAQSLRSCKKLNKAKNENSLSLMLWIAVAVLLALAFLPPYFGYGINHLLFCAITVIMIIPAVLSFIYILNFDGYRWIYKELLKLENFVMGLSKEAITTTQKLNMHKKITIDPSQTSDKVGYKYFNELFMKRHSKLLTRSAKRITISSIIVFVAFMIACFMYPNIRKDINIFLHSILPYFLFVMYFINRGNVITQAMFMNCDHSMLCYSFYRQPKAILLLFIERLKDIIIINLMPALVIALGLPCLLYVTGGTDQPLNYILLFISIIAMSIFFSVHNIILYYLIQPYNVNLELKSTAYSLANLATYIICYVTFGMKIPTLIFGTAISIFCIVYAIVASVLAYKLAPKTFRIKQ